MPCGKPSLSHRPCPTPWRGHTSISPRSTRPAAHSSKRLWGLRHELFSITARSPSHTGVPTRSTCPDKWQLEAIPAACGEPGISAGQEVALPGLLGRKVAGTQALAVSKTFQRSNPEPLNYSLASAKHREPGSCSHL